MTKPLDPDIKQLKAADRAIRRTSPRMRSATINYLHDKYVLQPLRDRQKRTARTEG